MQDDRALRFSEDPPGDNAAINGGFFALHPAVPDRIAGGRERANLRPSSDGWAKRNPQQSPVGAIRGGFRCGMTT